MAASANLAASPLVPPDLSVKDRLVAGSLVLWKILAVYCMGVLFIAHMPWYLVPVGWALVAAAYSGCLLVGMDCSRSCFFENKAANELIGAIVLLPLLRSVESLRRSKNDTSAWLSRTWECLKTSMSEKRNGICISIVIIAGCMCCYYKGFLYLFKYWLVPFLYMHLTVGSFETKPTERYSYLALFPDVKKRAEMEKGMLEAVQKACEYIPVYNVNAMHAYLEKQFHWPAMQHPTTPAAIMNRIMLLRGKRDAILPIAALASLLIFRSAAAIGLAALCLGYCLYSLGVEARARGWLQNLNVAQAVYITGCHAIALWGLYVIPSCHAKTLAFAFLLWPISGFGITGGAHRLWSHKSYEAAWPFRLLLLICNGMANEGSIYRWSRDHRVHHLASETDADPHNAKRGFFFSHMGWLYLNKDPRVVEAGRKLNFDDLLQDPLVRFQHVCDPWFNMFWCFVFPPLFAWYFWGESLLNGYLVPGMVRYVWTLHGTWLVNSVAHLWGERPYDPNINPTENFLVSVAAIGEGWHNWHHAYPYDYAASELGVSHQFNPTKLVLDLAASVGLVYNRKRGTVPWKSLQQRRVEEQLQRVEAAKRAAAALAEPCKEEGEGSTAEAKMVAAEDAAKGKAIDGVHHLRKVDGQPAQVQLEALTVRDIRQVIPARCFKRNTFVSMFHFFYDCAVLAASAWAVVFAAEHLSWWAMLLVWPAYWWYQGLSGTALWVLAHECGHGGFTDYKWLNDAVGFVSHSLVLTPYWSWALTHAKHHRRTNHMSEGETWVPAATKNPEKPKVKFFKTHRGTILRIAITWSIGWYLYLFNNETGAIQNRGQSHFNPNSKALFRPKDRPWVLASDAGVVAMLAILAWTVSQVGLYWVVMVYLVPQVVTNAFLVTITFMQHTHTDIPHLDFPQWNWLNGALCTIDRSMGPWVDSKLHHIVDTHVVHHLFSDMPFYGAKEATPYVAAYLSKFGPGVYNTIPTGYFSYFRDFYYCMKDALVVVREPDAEIYYFK